jgi:hypothetical protein
MLLLSPTEQGWNIAPLWADRQYGTKNCSNNFSIIILKGFILLGSLNSLSYVCGISQLYYTLPYVCTYV